MKNDNNSKSETKKVTKIYFDTEFTGLHQHTTLISIGFISDCGKEFYAELTDYDQSQINDWLKENVINSLLYNHRSNENQRINPMNDNYRIKGDKAFLKECISEWLAQFESIKMVSDCLSYDWVLFCQIFGHAFSIPENVYYIPTEICTMFEMKGIDPDISREEFATDVFSMLEDGTKVPMFLDEHARLMVELKHNALFDAIIIKRCYDKLIKMENV